MAAGFETLDPDSLVTIIPIVKDGNNQVSHGVPMKMTLAEFGAAMSSTGSLPQAANVAAAAVPFADLTAAANKVNEIITALKNANLMATS